MRLTLDVSARAVAFGLPVAVATAYVLARGRFPGCALLDSVVLLPLVLPPVVVGWLLLLLFGLHGPVGAWLWSWFGVRLVFTRSGAVLACAVMIFPLMVRAIRLSLEAVDPGLEQAARTLGAGALDRFCTITLPLAGPGVLTGAVIGFAASLGEFGAVITFAANIPGQTQTLPLAIYTALQAPGGENAAARLSLVSVGTGAGVPGCRGAAWAGSAAAHRAMTLAVRFRHDYPGVSLDIDFEAPVPGTTVLFGRSGAGKSTIISVVAGLFRPASCHVSVNGTVLADTDRGVFVLPERRRIGLVFQDARLFPHMTVAGNLRYGLRRAAGRAIQFGEVVDLLGLERMLARRPGRLSGGERSRVAIGRALLSQPVLLAMDEPLASLDEQHKAEILPYLARLKHGLSLPILYVTHALDEVARLADLLVLIRAGHVVASGALNAVLSRGDLPFAERDDAGAVLDARIVAHDTDRHLTALVAGGRSLLVPLLADAPGTELRVRVPAREVILATEAPQAISVQNVIAGTVRKITEDATHHAALVEVALDGAALLARVTPDAVARLGLRPNAPVLALVKSVAIEVLD